MSVGGGGNRERGKEGEGERSRERGGKREGGKVSPLHVMGVRTPRILPMNKILTSWREVWMTTQKTMGVGTPLE